ncbi:MAG: FCD domain-containing protein [Luteitalea sp.]|nr:FCD domain-containing protein [Luteitalea sp.]
MSKPFMSGGKPARHMKDQMLEPLSGTLQLGARAYGALWNGIVGGRIEPGTQLRPDAIAEQLEISTTPVREALHRLEGDGLVVKLPYQGWFVREFTEQEVRELYEMRAALECFSVRLACERITDTEVARLREHQAVGEAALRDGDMDAYRIYNRDLHAAIMAAARNSYLSSLMGQLTLQSQILMAKTIRLLGRPSRAIEEHHELIELIANRQTKAAQKLMERHILSALEDIVRFGIRGHAEAADESGGSGLKSHGGSDRLLRRHGRDL